ncbi:hypothetical protein CONPUDRAFT_74244 [Coniophora puteana RWD-64-598 SS2]|uniref:Uncharacterized protein n=1 Tax=Coniophora puteana (strain RWD-64-598) TaxID=741705 RepID=A0A5M3MMK9_CONPW|nr:uncharacterized protein CONPUDRAFT_74244 [Coniophora puteana RWD-64-598 SS2]EIW79935.1 hypothetical protein CONPUDRAFT_74244 [Coniophora puteana RWD-64-598 SS2]
MSSAELQTLISLQTSAYMNALDVGREAERYSKTSKILYSISSYKNNCQKMRYGGLFFNMVAHELEASSPGTVILTFGMVSEFSLFAARNAMMAMRIYGLFGRDKWILWILGPYFLGVLGASVVIVTMTLVSRPLNITVIPLSAKASWCEVDFSAQQAWYQTGLFISLAVYEVMLFALCLMSLVKRLRERTGSNTMNSLLGLMIRDNILYFFIALVATIINISTFFPNGLNFVSNLVYTNILSGISTAFYYSMLGPLMMLSIREYDVRVMQQMGGTSYEDEEQTLEFAQIMPQVDNSGI